MNITGDVERINIRDGYKFIAFTVTHEKQKSVVFFDGYLPVNEGDRIHVVGKEIEDEQYGKVIKPSRRPLIVLPSKEEYVIDCFFRSKACSQANAARLYIALERSYPGAKAIDEYLTRLSVEGVPNGFCLPVLNDRQTNKLLWWWKKNVSYRRLYLLGMTKSDIEQSGMSPDLLYREILHNPIKIPSIDIRKAVELCTIIGKDYSSKDLECGEIIRFIYRNCQSKGWTGTPVDEVSKKYNYSSLKEEIAEEYGIISYKDLVYFKQNYDAEKMVAEFVDELIIRTTKDYIMRSGEPSYRQYNLRLSKEQTDAVIGCLEHSICVLTGGAGTGKTSCIRELVLNLELQELDYRVCALAGKAVGRINEVLRFGGVNRKKKSYTLDRLIAQGDLASILIMDEMSMITVDKIYRLLMCYLQRGMKIQKLIMVGDCNQLPPIGWGSVFSQLIRSERVPVYRLTRNYRIEKARQLQNLDEGGLDERVFVRGILENANRLVDPERDVGVGIDMEESDGLFIIPTENILKVKSVLKAIRKYNVDVNEISSVVPYKKDVPVINKFFQEVFHANKEGVMDDKGNIWLKGDRVMQTVNNYEINVYNGTEGVVTEVTESTVTVDFDGEQFQYLINDREESDTRNLNISQITHSYAKTVHKAQGSEYRFLIFFVSHDSRMLTNNFLYTAITRAKMKIWLIGDPKVFRAMSTRLLPKRYERLSDRIIDLRTEDEDEMFKLCKYQPVFGDSMEGISATGCELEEDYEPLDFDDDHDKLFEMYYK